MPYLSISIIIPSFNQGQYLEECLTSILSQNYPALEVIVIDGGSTDQSVQIIEKFQDKITYWISEKDEGQSHAINKGMEHATGEIISWLCSDDMYVAGSLFEVNRIFQTQPVTTGVVYGKSELFKNEKNIRIEAASGEMNIERVLSGMSFPQPSSFFRMPLLKVTGKLNTELHFGMDYDLFSRLSMCCDFIGVDFCFSRYRIHDQSKTIISTSKFIGDWIIIFNSICEGLRLNTALSTLEKLNIRVKSHPNILKFFSKISTSAQLNEERLIYYFLSNVIRYDYESARFDRAREVANELATHYSKYLLVDSPIRQIVNRARFVPPLFLQLARQVTRSRYFS